MRLFTALEIKPEDRERIFRWADSYLLLPSGQIAQTNYHITLAFFGDIKHQNTEPLIEHLVSVNERFPLPTVKLTLDQVAFWPKTGIIWIGPSAWPKELTHLSASHANAGSRYGARKSNRPYQPHISLTRGAQYMNAPLQNPEIELEISNVSLFESRQNSHAKVEYHSLERWSL